MKGEGYKIRLRGRQGYVREAQGYTTWMEYQVLAGRKVVARFEHLDAARTEYPGAELDATVRHAAEIAAKQRPSK